MSTLYGVLMGLGWFSSGLVGFALIASSIGYIDRTAVVLAPILIAGGPVTLCLGAVAKTIDVMPNKVYWKKQ